MESLLDKKHSLRKLMITCDYSEYNGVSLPKDIFKKEFKKNVKLRGTIKKLAKLIAQKPMILFLPPNIKKSDLRRDFDKLQEINISPKKSRNKYIIDNRLGNVKGGALGDVLQRYFHPHFLKIKVWGKQSLHDVMKPINLEKALWYNFRYHHTPYRLGVIRSLAFTTGGFGFVSRFSAVFTKTAITCYKSKVKKVLDPCAGFGGRLLGVASMGDTIYYGCEPHPATFNGLQRMIRTLNIEDRTTVINLPAEDALPTIKSKSFDMILTSPPYFNQEVYSVKDTTQSVNRHPQWNEWSNKWLRKVIHSSLRCLKNTGVSAWSVQDIRQPSGIVLPLRQHVINYHVEKGWFLRKIIVRRGNSRPGSQKATHETEILCFHLKKN